MKPQWFIDVFDIGPETPMGGETPVKSLGPFDSLRKAEKVERGFLINLDESSFCTEIRSAP